MIAFCRSQHLEKPFLGHCLRQGQRSVLLTLASSDCCSADAKIAEKALFYQFSEEGTGVLREPCITTLGYIYLFIYILIFLSLFIYFWNYLYLHTTKCLEGSCLFLGVQNWTWILWNSLIANPQVCHYLTIRIPYTNTISPTKSKKPSIFGTWIVGLILHYLAFYAEI